MKLLLISNSTNAGEEYLKYPIQEIGRFLTGGSEVLFVPFAGVTTSYDAYHSKVSDRFAEVGVRVRSLHTETNPVNAVEQAQAIVVGGGNTFALLKGLQDCGVIDMIATRVKAGIPYIGWSAGSNLACPTIRTTNDMPIVEPHNFKAINLIKFQINPHYLDANPEGHAGETREQRILEFVEANKDIYVAGLREGCMLKIEDNNMKLIGQRSLRLFHYGQQPKELTSQDDLGFLL